MSKYTTQLRWIVENYTKEYEGFPLSQRIEYSLPKLFNFNFPIWNEVYRKTLEKKIVLHYINKEIGLETVELWKLYLEERLNLIMPYYNELYKTVSKEYDWLTDTNIVDSFNSERISSDTLNSTGEGSSTSSDTQTLETTSTVTGKNLKSDLPQANYAGVDYGTELNEVDDTNTSNESATKSNNITNNTQASTTTTGNAIENRTNTRKGANGNRSLTSLMLEYRQSLINIDKKIIDELYDLFMLIY